MAEVTIKEKGEYEEFLGKVAPEVKAQLPPTEEVFGPERRKARVSAKAPRRRRVLATQVGEAKRVGRQTVGLVTSVGIGLLKAAALTRHLKGIRHPDELIDERMKPLYLPSNPQFTPLGRFMENPMELYFGRSQRGMPPHTGVVYSALQQGYDADQLEVVTGLSPQQINRCLDYLKRKKLIEGV